MMPSTKDLPLFEYPMQPGSKTKDGPSREAARRMKPRAGTLRAEILEALKRYGPMSADETAVVLSADKLGVRPRFTELLKMGLIVDTLQRRRNESGMRATIYRVK